MGYKPGFVFVDYLTLRELVITHNVPLPRTEIALSFRSSVSVKDCFRGFLDELVWSPSSPVHRELRSPKRWCYHGSFRTDGRSLRLLKVLRHAADT